MLGDWGTAARRAARGAPRVPTRRSAAPSFAWIHRRQSRHPCRTLAASFAAAATAAASQPSGAAAAERPWLAETHTHPAFEVVRRENIDEYGAAATLYQHRKTGAELLSISVDDNNKVFGATFRTPCVDSAGAPHVLEHSVLCGSRKYRSKEPFVQLIKGSLNTFLNAFTYPDRTCYPVASQNLKDFYNLAHVYIDAVLHPRAVRDPKVFQQEGWHYEISETGELSRTGVVLNEMKGLFSSPDDLLHRATQSALFPNNTYAHIYGGDPEVIPSLSFEKLRDYHQSYYHPSNARFFFYGDDPVPARLDFLESYLGEFDANPAVRQSSAIQWQPPVAAPTTVTFKFPSSEESKGEYMATVNWVITHSELTPEQSIAVAVLDHVLMGTTTSLLYQPLLKSGLGSRVIGGGVADHLLQWTFHVGLKGVSKENTTKVTELVLSTLRQIAEQGVPADAVEASINSIEFALRELNSGSYPRGLAFMLSANRDWLYDRDPLDAIRFEKPLAALKEQLAAPGQRVLEELVSRLLLDNTHRVDVVMEPDTELEEKRAREEKAELEAAGARMTSEEKAKVAEEVKALKEAQNRPDTPEELATIPRLSIADIDREVQGEVLREESAEEGGLTLLRHPISSNGILYVVAALDLSCLSLEEEVALLPLFTRMLLEVGTKELDEVALQRRIGARTGGISASWFASPRAGAPSVVVTGDDLVARLVLRGKCTASRVSDLFDLLGDVLLSANLDRQQRVVELLKEKRSAMQAAISRSGHMYVGTRIDAAHTLGGFVSELSGGLSHLRVVEQLLAEAEGNWASLLQRLERLRANILARKGAAVLSVTGDRALLDNAMPAVRGFIARLPPQPQAVGTGCKWKAALLPAQNEGYHIPTQANYVGWGGRMFEPGEVVPASMGVVSRALSVGWLWQQVRVLGGAYGAFARLDRLTGVYSMRSYRDPQLKGTLDIYRRTADELAAGPAVAGSDLEDAVIGAIGDMDSPLLPDAKGERSMKQWLLGETREMRQQQRDEVLRTSAADFRLFGERLRNFADRAHVHVIGSPQALEQANAELPEGQRLRVHSALSVAALASLAADAECAVGTVPSMEEVHPAGGGEVEEGASGESEDDGGDGGGGD
eukprot:TRINITY_DN61095_c0_g1_i1.p1 TRINITY_DN61095_c0_g1~~TRINITY_DN61095_c0_g1_i1.p1  ORF type:complete len:1144 (+),score=404.60 TRINITY_DN61095_c0_g1_i1:76-3432(+)